MLVVKCKRHKNIDVCAYRYKVGEELACNGCSFNEERMPESDAPSPQDSKGGEAEGMSE